MGGVLISQPLFRREFSDEMYTFQRLSFQTFVIGSLSSVATSLTAFISSYLMGNVLISQPLFRREFSDETYILQQLSFQTFVIGSLSSVVAFTDRFYH